MTTDILVIGNSWTIPSLEVRRPWTDQLGLFNRIEANGITLDAQAELVLNNRNYAEKIIWLVTGHHRADPRGNGSFLLPYPWGEGDIWGDKDRALFFKYFTRRSWFDRTSALFVRAAIMDMNKDNLLLIPLYKPSVLDHPWVQKHPSIWREYLGTYRKKYPDGRGHTNQEGHNIFTQKVRKEIQHRWTITL